MFSAATIFGLQDLQDLGDLQDLEHLRDLQSCPGLGPGRDQAGPGPDRGPSPGRARARPEQKDRRTHFWKITFVLLDRRTYFQTLNIFVATT